MNLRMGMRACLVIVLVVGVTAGAEVIQSGPKVGDEITETFEPVNITGADAGRKTCILCEYAESPVVLVFARDVSEPLTRLIKRLDAASAQHKASSLGTCVVFLSSEEGLPRQVKQVADREKIRLTALRTYKPEGPKGYNVAKEADISVILFTDRVVKATHAFKKGEMKDKDIDLILADVVKILPSKK